MNKKAPRESKPSATVEPRVDWIITSPTPRQAALQRIIDEATALLRSLGMTFRVGTRVYTVRRKWDLRMDGRSIDGLCSGSNRALWLDGELPIATIVDVLRHEHTHAWHFEVGIPHSIEDNASFNSTVGAAFDFEFNAQGGLAALLAIPIEGTRPKEAA